MNPSALLLLCLGCVVTSAYVIQHPTMWSKLILTHHWPTTFCGMEHCHSNFSYWTLHGLWPDKGQDCNASWPFNTSLIEDLIPDMEKSWPDLIKPTSPGFWKYEWHKHGTCAARAASLDSQHKYFSKALDLYHKLDLDGVLRKFNIIPSENHYSLDEIEGAILKFYQVKPKIQCVHQGKGKDIQILGQIEICFDPEFQLENCAKTDGVAPLHGKAGHPGLSVCTPDIPVYYPPTKTGNHV